MSQYEALAGFYDALTRDVDYRRQADFLEKLLRRSHRETKTILDLACGTGTMTCLLTERGYEMIAVDASEDMLAIAREKAAGLSGEPPLFLHQEMQRLDLYDTVDAAICCLDSFNYLTRIRDLRRTLERLHLFLSPGGLLVFDINSPEKLRGLDGQVFLDETEDIYCVWRVEFEKRTKVCAYYMDLFTRLTDDTWRRDLEIHQERAYEVEELRELLTQAGFGEIRTYGDCRLQAPKAGEQRIYFSAVRLPL